jgi:hypothetical protein
MTAFLHVFMTCHIKPQVTAAIKTSGRFSFHVDETTDMIENEQLVAYVHYPGLTDVEEEFLFCQPLTITTTGED